MKPPSARTLLPLLLLLFLGPAPRALSYYDPGAQRWLNRDPIQEVAGFNLFTFLRYNPVAAVDINGLIDPHAKPAPGELDIGGTCKMLLDCSTYLHKVWNDAEQTAMGLTGTKHATAGSTADALTHCIGACETAKNPGPCKDLGTAKYWIDRREDWGNTDDPEKSMDFLNNQAGYALGKKPGGCAQNCLNSLVRGGLYTISPKGTVVFFPRLSVPAAPTPPPFPLLSH